MVAEYNSRVARKRWECRGNGGSDDRRDYAEGCTGLIEPGQLCIELLDETPAYQSGPRCCLACAEQFHGVDIALEIAARSPGCAMCVGPVDAAGRCEECGALQVAT